MKILVTGGYGFIGSHVLRQLVDAGHDVGCFDLADPSPVAKSVADSITDITGDISDPVAVYNAVASFAPDRIIHLAALLGRPSQQNPRIAFDVNVTGSLYVLEAACELGVDRVVGASSVSSYGTPPSDVAVLDESVVQQPENIYGLTKYVLEKTGRAYQKQRGIEFGAIEPVHGLGPDRNRGNVEDAFIVKAAVSETPITIPAVEYPIEIIYVGDEASAFVRAATADQLPHDRYIIGTGERYTLREIAEITEEMVPGAEFTFSDTRGDDELENLPPSDASRIQEDLGWEPTLSVPEIIETYIEWLRDNPDAWTFDPSNIPWE